MNATARGHFDSLMAALHGIARLLLMIALSAASAIASAQDRSDEARTRHVVVLNATDPYLPAFIEVDRGLNEVINQERETPIELHAETLDMARFPRTLEEDVAALLRKKYHGVKVEVVVTFTTLALDFAERYGAEIWPGAAIVFTEVPSDALAARRLDARTIGVPVRIEFGPTVDLALKLRPATRRLVVIGGTGDTDQRTLLLVRASLERYAGRLEIDYLVGRTLAETVAAVRALPADAVVLFATVFRDGAGAPLVPRDVLTRVAAASSVPIFGVFETYLGDGIAAGSIASFETQGRRAGELVVRVLNGEDAAAIGVQSPVVPRCIADWRQLGHWGIDDSLLPSDCEVRFREVSAWERYRWQILGALAVILAQGLLIAALMLNRRRLGRAQNSLREEFGRRTQAETFAAQLRGRLERFSKERSLGTMATTISHEVNQPLIAIQNYANAARRRLESNVDDKPKLLELFAKIEGQAARAGAITQRVRSLVSSDEVRLFPVALLPLIEEVVRSMEPEFGSRGCRIVLEPVGALPAVLADALDVQLVLVNLLRNAMQSVCSSGRSPGEVSVSVDVRPIDDRHVQVSVTDWGRGVPPERAADIFQPLYSGAGGGMGMGLAISRAIVEAHGGQLWYDPNPAGGAIFRFSLRVARP
jgi:signal transduction histidine kinase